MTTPTSVVLRREEEAIARASKRILAESRRKLFGLLGEMDLGDVTLGRQPRRLTAIFSRADEIILNTYRQMNEVVRERLVTVGANHGTAIAADLKRQVDTLRASVPALKRGAFTLPVPTRAEFRALATSTPVRGEVMGKWWGRQSRATRERFRDAVRNGYLNGETGDQIQRRVRDTLGVSARQAEALSRTATNAIANKAAVITYYENRDIVQAYQYLAAVDDRTTDLCLSLNLNVYRLDDAQAPLPPQHFNCRSTTIPVLDYRALGVPTPADAPRVPET